MTINEASERYSIPLIFFMNINAGDCAARSKKQ